MKIDILENGSRLRRPQSAKWMLLTVCCLGAMWSGGVQAGEPPKPVRGLYLAPYNYGDRKIAEVAHYAALAGLNAAVLHVKDPHGFLFWDAKNATAKEIGAVQSDTAVPDAVRALKAKGIWTVAKVDVFQDSLLAAKHPELSVQDSRTGKAWKNKDGLGWVNPYDRRVWDYVIALAKELVELGVDEIQFDYVRFPSDGTISAISYPVVLNDKSKVETIGEFAKAARAVLKPLGATISVDLFGMVAWRTDDFGVGQRIEEIAPHVDAICPMLYPSHFPAGFLGKKDPSAFPREIMELSMRRMQARTSVTVRPWIQGFWYTPDEIIAQMEGLETAGSEYFFVWNPASIYDQTYDALAKKLKKEFPAPKLYPALAELEGRDLKELRGTERVINATDYAKGISTLSLESPGPGKKTKYGTPAAVIGTLDEAIMDSILQSHGVSVTWKMSYESKVGQLVKFACQDLKTAPNRMSVRPFVIQWKGDCRFVASEPRTKKN